MSSSYGTLVTEFKADESGNFEGYGAVFNNVDLGGDVILPGAFKESLRERSVAMLWAHDPTQVVGKWDEVKEDSHGLFVRGRFAETALGRDTHTLVKMQAATGLSIGYGVREKNYRSNGDRELVKLLLGEVSVLPMPMNEEARITMVKSYAQGSPRELEHVLRDAGMSSKFAKTVVSGLCNRDEEEQDPLAKWLAGVKSGTDATEREIIRNAIRG